MKARLAVILIVLAIAALAFAVLKYPRARRPTRPPGPSTDSPRPGPTAATPRDAVVQYVEALYRKDFETAYRLLSSDSRKAHPYDDFAQVAQSGATDFDLGAAREGEEKDGRVTVTVPLSEDPAEAGFTTVREEGGWRVVYIGGVPWFPYAEPEAETNASDG